MSTRSEVPSHTAQLLAVTEALTALLETDDWREASEHLLRCALELTHSEYGFVGALYEGRLRVLGHAGLVWDEDLGREFYEQAQKNYREQGYLEFERLDNLFGRGLLSGEAVISNDPSGDPRAGRRLPAGHPPLESFLGVPILRDQALVGMIGLANRPGGYGERDQAEIEVLTRHASVLYEAYGRREREQELRRRHHIATEALSQSEGRWRTLFEQAADAILVQGFDGRFVEANEQASRLLGYPREELLQLTVSDVYPEYDPTEVQATFERILADPVARVVGTSEGRARRKDGSELSVEVRYGFLEDSAAPQGRWLLAHVRDVSERAEAEAQLRLYKAIFEATVEPITVLTPGGKFIAQNEAHRRLLGFSDEELFGMGPADLVGKEELARNIDEIDRRGSVQRTINCRAQDGSSRLVELTAFSVLDEDGEPVCGVGIKRDPSHWLAAVEQVVEGVAVLGAHGRVHYVNQAFQRITGFSLEDLYGGGLGALYEGISASAAQYAEVLERTRAGYSWTGELLSRHKEGATYEAELTVTPSFDANEQVETLAVVLRDVTQVRQNQRLEAMGSLVSGVAHEINNPVNFILFNLPILQEAWRDSLPILDLALAEQPEARLARLPWATLREEMAQVLEGIGTGAQRIQRIISDLKSFGRAGHHTSIRFDPRGSIDTAVRFVQHELSGRGVELQCEISEELPRLQGSPNQLEQPLVNLLQNAIQAVPDGSGRVELTVRTDEGGGLEVVVADNGPGVPLDLSRRVFIPFFTTKKDTGGTGLGLTFSEQMIGELGGRILVEANQPQGARFRVSIPPAPQPRAKSS